MIRFQACSVFWIFLIQIKPSSRVSGHRPPFPSSDAPDWRAMPAPFGFAEIGFRGGCGVSTAPIRRVRPRRHRPMEGGIRPIARSRDVAVLHRIPMDVIDRPVEIVLIADCPRDGAFTPSQRLTCTLRRSTWMPVQRKRYRRGKMPRPAVIT